MKKTAARETMQAQHHEVRSLINAAKSAYAAAGEVAESQTKQTAILAIRTTLLESAETLLEQAGELTAAYAIAEIWDATITEDMEYVQEAMGR